MEPTVQRRRSYNTAGTHALDQPHRVRWQSTQCPQHSAPAPSVRTQHEPISTMGLATQSDSQMIRDASERNRIYRWARVNRIEHHPAVNTMLGRGKGPDALLLLAAATFAFVAVNATASTSSEGQYPLQLQECNASAVEQRWVHDRCMTDVST